VKNQSFGEYSTLYAVALHPFQEATTMTLSLYKIRIRLREARRDNPFLGLVLFSIDTAATLALFVLISAGSYLLLSRLLPFS